MEDTLFCFRCKSTMILDDVDFNFKGNKDNYFYCENCDTVAIQKIRYGKVVRTDWAFDVG